MVLPTASLLSFEGFAVIAEVTGVTHGERGVVDLLAHPFLPCTDRRAAVGALVGEAIDHFYPQTAVQSYRCAISVPIRRHSNFCQLLPFGGQRRRTERSNSTQKVRACVYQVEPKDVKVLPVLVTGVSRVP